MSESIADIQETFALLPGWEERYAYLIDLGRKMASMDPVLKTDDVLVPGCTSKVWMVVETKKSVTGETIYHFQVDSDAAIVKGLVAVLMAIVQDKTAAEIGATDVRAIFTALDLETNLSPNRRNGFFAMVERIDKLIAS